MLARRESSASREHTKLITIDLQLITRRPGGEDHEGLDLVRKAINEHQDDMSTIGRWENRPHERHFLLNPILSPI